MRTDRMKLIIQIPCLNEADQIAETLVTIPRDFDGVDVTEIMIVDDGSTDDTVAVALAAGAHHVHSNPTNLGLARTYVIGLEQALLRGADLIVNMDADNQYPARFIQPLIDPILAGRAELTVGARPIDRIAHFSPLKRRLQRFGSWVVRRASGLNVPDAPSGFRAVSRSAAMRLYTFSSYSYTIETLIQAGRINIPIASVPIETNPPTRPSRLMRSMLNYILKSMATILRIGMLYYPFRVFFWTAIVVATPGILAILRFVLLYLSGDGEGRLQSLVLGSALFATGAVLMIGGVLADLIAANRMLLQDLRARALEEKLAREARK
ncbi:MAG: glycosyltransferase family 2 protein [Pseudomonadota bacterium]